VIRSPRFSCIVSIARSTARFTISSIVEILSSEISLRAQLNFAASYVRCSSAHVTGRHGTFLVSSMKFSWSF
jgi:hypothetical protein